MFTQNRASYIILLLGDISTLYFSVWVTLTLRHLSIPNTALIVAHLTSFTFLFLAWFFIYAIAGLYGKYTLIFRRKLPQIIFIAQSFNVVIAGLFFLTIPFFQITPKTILVIYLVVSTILLYVWRVYMFPQMMPHTAMGAVLIGSGNEYTQLIKEIHQDTLYPISIRSVIHPEHTSAKEIESTIRLLIESGTVSTVIADPNNIEIRELLPYIYESAHVQQRVSFIDMCDLYQEIFEKVPLSLITGEWVLHTISTRRQRTYDVFKRSMDIVLALLLAPLALFLFPFVAVAIKYDDGGSIFTAQERVGTRTNIHILYKFRTMTYTDTGAWVGANADNTVTRVGAFLRKTHIDELPQIYNVLRGELSFVGPRPDIVGLYKKIVETTPFYTLRYTIKPGLTGWAQINQRYQKGNNSPQSLSETQERLQYDLYYVKNRSLLLDMKIAVLTFGTVVNSLIKIRT